MFMSCTLRPVDEKEILIHDKCILIDVRTAKEYKEGHLKNAINIPYAEIKDKIREYVKDKDEKIILYCRSGRRSGIAKKILEGIGYKNVVDAGVYEKLKKFERKNEKKEKNKISKSGITIQCTEAPWRKAQRFSLFASIGGR